VEFGTQQGGEVPRGRWRNEDGKTSRQKENLGPNRAVRSLEVSGEMNMTKPRGKRDKIGPVGWFRPRPKCQLGNDHDTTSRQKQDFHSSELARM